MARYGSYGSYGARFGNFNEAALAIEIAQSVRQRPVMVSATMVMVNSLSPTPEQIAGYARLLVYAGAITFNLNDIANLQSVRTDWGILGCDRILLNHVFPINNGISLVMPLNKSPLYCSQENQSLGAVLVCPCDRLGVVMEGLGNLTFFGAVDEDADVPQYKVV